MFMIQKSQQEIQKVWFPLFHFVIKNWGFILQLTAVAKPQCHEKTINVCFADERKYAQSLTYEKMWGAELLCAKYHISLVYKKQ